MNLLNPIYTLLLYVLYESQILNHPTSNPDEDTHTIALINPWKFSEFSHVRALLFLLLSKRSGIMIHDSRVILPLMSIHNSWMNVLNLIYTLFLYMLQ